MRLLNSVCKLIASKYAGVPVHIEELPNGFKRECFLVTLATNGSSLKNRNVYEDDPTFQIVYFGTMSEADQVVAENLYRVKEELKALFLLRLAIPVIPLEGVQEKSRYAKIQSYTDEVRLGEGALYAKLTLSFTGEIEREDSYEPITEVDFATDTVDQTVTESPTEDYSNGYAEGNAEGYANGYTEGHSKGKEEGITEGYDKGKADGYSTGFAEGKDKGYGQGIDEGYNNGKVEGYDTGYTDGYDVGYDEGYDEGNTDGHYIGWNEGNYEGYNSGYEIGKTDGYNEGKTDGYNSGKADGEAIGLEAGRKAEYEAFWDEALKSTNCIGKFAGRSWTKNNFRPTKDLNITSNCNYCFYNNGASLDFPEIAQELGINIAIKPTSAIYMFQYSNIKSVDVDFTECTALTNVFDSCTSLITLKLKLKEDGTNTFSYVVNSCTKLKDVTIESGFIGKNISFQYSPLTTDSMISVIDHLKNYAGTTTEGKCTVTFSSECWAELEKVENPYGMTWKEYVQLVLGWLV